MANLITKAGLNKLQADLDYRISVVRNEIAKEIEFARGFGDLSENAEYTEAKNKQAENEREIARLQEYIRNSEVVSDDSTDKVNLGATVQVKDVDTGDVETYVIVGAKEADPFEGKISNECPVGEALMGKVAGDTVEVEIPAGVLHLTVLSITRPEK